MCLLGYSQSQSPTFDLRMRFDSANSTHLYTTVQMKANVSSFELGSFVVFFDYNAAALGAPEVEQSFAYAGYDAGSDLCLSGNCVYSYTYKLLNAGNRTGLASNLLSIHNGAILPMSFTDVVQIRFPIVDPNADVNIQWRGTTRAGILEAPTVVKYDDDMGNVYESLLFGLNGPAIPLPGTLCGHDPFESNEDASNAKLLPLSGINKNARLCPSGDEDWYYFVVGTKNNISLKLSALPANYHLEVYDANEALVTGSYNNETDNELVWLNALPMGANYYVRVYGYQGASSEEGYKLKLQARNTPFTNPSLVKDTDKTLAGEDTESLEESLVEEQSIHHISIYPNPANDWVNMDFFAAFEGEAKFRLIDVLGHPLTDWQENIRTGANQVRFDVTDYSAGIYYIEVRFGEAIFVNRVVKY